MTQEDRDLILRVEAKVDRLLERQQRTDERVADHEARIRSNERWKYSVPFGVITAIGLVVGAILKG